MQFKGHVQAAGTSVDLSPARVPVRIGSVEFFPVTLPLRQPMHMAGLEIRRADNLLVKITSDSGCTGWGEAASAPAMTGETVESMCAAVRYLSPFLIGRRADDFAAIDRELAWRMYGNHAAKGALDMALVDLVARTRGVPMHALLGPALRQRVPLLWLIGTGTAEEDLAYAAACRREGFTAFKIKIGTQGARDDALRTQAICEVIGDGMLIGADANQGYDERSAMEYVRAVEHTALVFVEQPVAGHDLESMARVAAASGVAIGADEGIHSEHDIRRHHAQRAAEGCSLKVIKLGGPRALFRAGQLCHSLGMRVNLACKVAESGVAGAALLHLAAALPAVDWGVSLSCQYLDVDLVGSALQVEQGCVRVPSGAGLGVDVDEDAVRTHLRHM